MNRMPYKPTIVLIESMSDLEERHRHRLTQCGCRLPVTSQIHSDIPVTTSLLFHRTCAFFSLCDLALCVNYFPSFFSLTSVPPLFFLSLSLSLSLLLLFYHFSIFLFFLHLSFCHFLSLLSSRPCSLSP